MKILPSVTIAIAAYNAEANLSALIQALLQQKHSKYRLNRIIIHDDCSQDCTAAVIKSMKSPLIKLITGRRRKGFAGTVKYLIKNYHDEITILLNDDIRIRDQYLIEKLISAFNSPKVGLVTANPHPLPPTNFVEAAVFSSLQAYRSMRYHFRKGRNLFTCDGKVLAISDQFSQRINFPDQLHQMGNVDAYLYFECLSKGFCYRHIRSAKVYYRSPQTLRDYFRWVSRNNANRFLLQSRYGKLVDQEYARPLILNYYKLREFFKNPLGCLFIWVTSWYIEWSARRIAGEFNPLWETVTTSKNLTSSS